MVLLLIVSCSGNISSNDKQYYKLVYKDTLLFDKYNVYQFIDIYQNSYFVLSKKIDYYGNDTELLNVGNYYKLLLKEFEYKPNIAIKTGHSIQRYFEINEIQFISNGEIVVDVYYSNQIKSYYYLPDN